MTWTTDDIDIRRFTSPDAPGWILSIHPEVPSCTCAVPSRICVDTGNGDTEVDVSRDGIMVFGEESRGNSGCTPSKRSYVGVRFTIPWVIVREIVRYQDSVQSQP
jgi:hypothetical protein